MPQIRYEPLQAMYEAVVSLQRRNLEALTTGEGRGLSAVEMAAYLEAESGMRDLYLACEQALGAFEHNWAIDWDVLTRALAKARGENPYALPREPTNQST